MTIRGTPALIINQLSRLRQRPPPAALRLAATPLQGDVWCVLHRLALASGNLGQREFRRRLKGTAQHPIPRDWHFAGPRQSRVGNKTDSRNARASHPLNAMLNYAYVALESQIRIQIGAAGYDASIGFLHETGSRKNAFVLDLMEPLRPIVDRAILHHVQEQTFAPADFVIKIDGGCSLNPEMSRHVVRLILAQMARQDALSWHRGA